MFFHLLKTHNPKSYLSVKNWFWLLGVLFSCQSEPIFPIEYEVPEEVLPYLSRFKSEASRRGVNIYWDELEIQLVDGKSESPVAGTCHLYHSRGPKILIDTTSYNWKHSEWTREVLIFHELGHSLLNRTHRNDRFPNGLHTSIMRETGDPLYGGNINSYKRSYYLDELFDEDLPRPVWAKAQFNQPGDLPWKREVIFSEEFEDNISGWPERETSQMKMNTENGRYLFRVKEKGAFFSGKIIPLEVERDFEVEVKMRISRGDNPVLLQWGGDSPEQMLYLGFTSDQYAFVGKRNEGTSTGRKFISIKPRDFNLLTVQKIDDRYYLYINEQLFDTLTFAEYKGNLWGFYLGSSTSLEVDYLRIAYLIKE